MAAAAYLTTYWRALMWDVRRSQAVNSSALWAVFYRHTCHDGIHIGLRLPKCTPRMQTYVDWNV